MKFTAAGLSKKKEIGSKKFCLRNRINHNTHSVTSNVCHSPSTQHDVIHPLSLRPLSFFHALPFPSLSFISSDGGSSEIQHNTFLRF